MTTLTLDEARCVRAHAQGLLDPSGGELGQVLARTGWIRTLGGVEAYLAIRARRPGTTVEDVHNAMASGELQVVPSVRGCIYLAPRQDAALCLRISSMLARRRVQRDLDKVGSSEAELNSVGEAIVDALQDGDLTTRQLKKALPEGTVRSFGDVGKKIGVTTSLPPSTRTDWTPTRPSSKR